MSAPSVAPMELGKFKIRQHEFKLAEEAFLKEVNQNPENHEAWFYIGFCRKRLYRVEEAVEPFEKAVNLFPSDPDYLYELALSYRTVRRHSDAFDAAKKLKNLSQTRFTAEKVEELVNLCSKTD